MLEIQWSPIKNNRLKKVRGVSFEEILQSKLLAVKEHHARKGQDIMLFEHRSYVWIVPYVLEERGVFLKTLYPSRKYTKMYKRGGKL